MDKFAVIVAGGSGQRMGSGIPKQFLLIKGKPVLAYTIQAFITAFPDVKIILVLPADHKSNGEQLVISLGIEDKVTIVTGGESRFQSVKNGLQLVPENSIVFIHDGVRCLVSPALIRRCFEQAVIKGSAIPAVSATDSIRLEQGNSHHTIDRNKIRIIQTPQTFKSGILLEAFAQDYQPSFTDEATVVESLGQPVYLIEGEYNNLKITRPIDLLIAEKLVEESMLDQS